MFIFGYLFGIATGFIIALIIGEYCARQDQKKILETATKMVDAVKKDTNLVASAKQRFADALKITDEQTALMSQLEGPSKGALYSQWRNGARTELIEMERRKMDILRTIVADGLDPVVTVTDDQGFPVKKKLSETIADFDAKFPPPTRDQIHPKTVPIRPEPKADVIKLSDAPKSNVIKFEKKPK